MICLSLGRSCCGCLINYCMVDPAHDKPLPGSNADNFFLIALGCRNEQVPFCNIIGKTSDEYPFAGYRFDSM